MTTFGHPNTFRSFAVVPAAGHSARMGRPKLLLPWRDRTVIEATLAAWRLGGVERVFVVVRPDDSELSEVVRGVGADVVSPTIAPPEMRDSIQHALHRIAKSEQPDAQDAWLLAPADMPTLSPVVIRALVAAHDPDRPRILAPVQNGRRGHPVLFPWPLAADVAHLSADQGVNSLLQHHGWTSVAVIETTIHDDLDTPNDYERLRDLG